MFFFEEGWKDQAAVEKHFQQPDFIRVTKALEPLLLEKPEIIYGQSLA